LLPGAAQTITRVALRPLHEWGDLLVRLAGREKAQTRQLVLRQRYTRPVSPALLGDFGRDPGRPGVDRSDRLPQLLSRHVARDGARGAGVQRPAQVVAGLVGAHQEDARVRVF